MDTRTKIVEWNLALERARHSHTAVVTGYFDPLTVDHARRLGELAARFDTVVVVLAEPPEPILEISARAALLAALDSVDYVAWLGEGTSIAEFEREENAQVFRDESSHTALFERLVKQVRSRHATLISH